MRPQGQGKVKPNWWQQLFAAWAIPSFPTQLPKGTGGLLGTSESSLIITVWLAGPAACHVGPLLPQARPEKDTFIAS